MDMFEKVKEVSGNVIGSAKIIGTSIYSTSKEQSELAGMKVQKSVIEKKLKEYYAVIGKRYVEYMDSADGSDTFDVSDILEEMQPDIDNLKEIIVTLANKEENAKKEEEERRQKKAQSDFEIDKAKLDKALSMDVISQKEYDEKLSVVQKKLDNYEQLRKIDMQLQMDIITKEEHMEKVNRLLF